VRDGVQAGLALDNLARFKADVTRTTLTSGDLEDYQVANLQAISFSTDQTCQKVTVFHPDGELVAVAGKLDV
jgi:hypothetical protein